MNNYKKIELLVGEGCVNLETLKLFFDEEIESKYIKDIDRKVNIFFVEKEDVLEKIKMFETLIYLEKRDYVNELWSEGDINYSNHLYLSNRRNLEEKILEKLKTQLIKILDFQKDLNNEITIYVDNNIEIEDISDQYVGFHFNFTIEIDNYTVEDNFLLKNNMKDCFCPELDTLFVEYLTK